MTGLGFFETYTYSFISPKVYDKLALAADDPLRDGILAAEPAGRRHVRDAHDRGRLAAGRTVLQPQPPHTRLRAVRERDGLRQAPTPIPPPTGFPRKKSSSCSASTGSGDFYDLKGVAVALTEALHIGALRFAADATVPYFHPGRCAAVYAGGTLLGRIGQLHPTVCDSFELSGDVYAGVFSTEALFARVADEWEYTPLPVYPAVERDLALVMDESTEAGTVEDAIRSYAGKSLCGVTVFDVYTGKGVADGKKSVAFRLSFRLPDKTMNDSEVDAAVTKILRRLESEKDITLRT